jgi:hypothetical protein
MITVSLCNFQGPLTITGLIIELFENLAKARTFEQSPDTGEEFNKKS